MNMPLVPSQVMDGFNIDQKRYAPKITNRISLADKFSEWLHAEPFPHLVIDNFLNNELAAEVSEAIPKFNSEFWLRYQNAIERKKTLNLWDQFPAPIYRLAWELCSPTFVSQLETISGCRLYPDFGLHGGGLHSHTYGEKLNVHLDYATHPKLGLERKLNLIIYLTKDWRQSWGGNLEFWSHDSSINGPGRPVKSISPYFNRAVIFDTTGNSWHGLPEPINSPEGVSRNSLAIYYLTDPKPHTSGRKRALFSPYKDQAKDPQVLDLIRRRSC